MENRAEQVHETMMKCLFEEGEPHDDAIIVDGIVNKFGFHPGRIKENKEKIRELLTGFEEPFYKGKGGGWSFLNFCTDAKGVHWAEHKTMGELVSLGIAAGLVEYCLPRDMWDVLPGGMPYITIDLEK